MVKTKLVVILNIYHNRKFYHQIFHIQNFIHIKSELGINVGRSWDIFGEIYKNT